MAYTGAGVSDHVSFVGPRALRAGDDKLVATLYTLFDQAVCRS